MPNIKFILQYDGTNYLGFQTQKKGRTIQSVLEESLEKLTNEKIKIISASRTDAGVHSLGQVVNFKTESKIPPEKFCYAINQILPDDIKVIESSVVDDAFHSRYRAKSKVYKYFIVNQKFQIPHLRNYSLHLPLPVNIEVMKKSAKYLIGKIDFASFRSTGTETKTTICNMKKISIVKKNNLIIFTFEAERFLRGMIRCIVGTLLDVGIGKKQFSEVKEILEAKDRKKAGKTAPPQGLFLIKVKY